MGAIKFGKTIAMGLVLGGLSMSCNADSYEDGLVAYAIGDYPLAAQRFFDAANSGSVGAEQMLARMFAEGSGVQRDSSEVLKWTRKAAQGGIPLAQYNLAEIYFNAEGTEANDLAAYQMFIKAAKGGVVLSYYRLGQMNELGRGVPQDADEAKYFYAVAASELDVFAQKGDAVAQNMLARQYENGKGVTRNYAKAMQWYRQAANQGLADAQFNVGRLFAAGTGVDKNELEAMNWLNRAASQGYAKAQELLKNYHDKMVKDGRGSLALANDR